MMRKKGRERLLENCILWRIEKWKCRPNGDMVQSECGAVNFRQGTLFDHLRVLGSRSAVIDQRLDQLSLTRLLTRSTALFRQGHDPLNQAAHLSKDTTYQAMRSLSASANQGGVYSGLVQGDFFPFLLFLETCDIAITAFEASGLDEYPSSATWTRVPGVVCCHYLAHMLPVTGSTRTPKEC
ncbi:hypothetical protein CEK26_013234 [Fusarium fujikuroi]|uniref:Uncharacterized protein n=1 Tax=Fusarium fujikuroi TaxID=5127 RepID=A0A5Q3GA25_FUSFU|nr:hypothetical protein CEK27_013248 [Fusarium fujikuroi]QGI86640.1 hypothetical protein CEK25_013369 [Fusarium fujikuroi]QGJ00166.1 hypothetical protein CEK26_013234 [Fusarium fujikuroi]VTT81436.1 unnamed protein product [Fusarium fujikuroi]VZI19421.1 unnamed protein product [Fusarium fujikuroi]